jgi:hypothetical protein
MGPQRGPILSKFSSALLYPKSSSVWGKPFITVVKSEKKFKTTQPRTFERPACTCGVATLGVLLESGESRGRRSIGENVCDHGQKLIIFHSNVFRSHQRSVPPNPPYNGDAPLCGGLGARFFAPACGVRDHFSVRRRRENDPRSDLLAGMWVITHTPPVVYIIIYEIPSGRVGKYTLLAK